MVKKLFVKKLSEHAKLPQRQSEGSAGYDLYSAHDFTLKPRKNGLIPTDLSISIPKGCYGRVAPRSGLALKYAIDVGAGVVDSDYRGPLGVVLFNHGEDVYSIKRGDRIAQLVIEVISTPDVEEVDDLDDTSRGSGGFGSTGQ